MAFYSVLIAVRVFKASKKICTPAKGKKKKNRMMSLLFSG